MNVYVAKTEAQKNSEKFDPLKLHTSVMAACYAVRALEGEAHVTARQVCERVIEWLHTKTEVTSRDIRRVATNFLKLYHPEAAFMYEKYREIV